MKSLFYLHRGISSINLWNGELTRPRSNSRKTPASSVEVSRRFHGRPWFRPLVPRATWTTQHVPDARTSLTVDPPRERCVSIRLPRFLRQFVKRLVGYNLLGCSGQENEDRERKGQRASIGGEDELSYRVKPSHCANSPLSWHSGKRGS